MNSRSFIALSILLVVLVNAAGPMPAAFSQTRTSRAPLAMLTGDVPWPDDERGDATPSDFVADGTRLHETAQRETATPVHLLRLPPDSLLVALMDSTSLDNITSTIQHMQDYGSRYVAVDSCWAAGYWIREQFIDYGLTDVELDTFRCWTFQDTVDAMNVVAWKEGLSRPDEYVVIGGHYDSVTTDNFTDPDAPAPGADDNGTGIAGVLEAARLLADLELERSVIFACWSGEELGLRGSHAWVSDAVASGLDIVIYLNMDCLGYPDEPDPTAIVYSDSSSLAVAALMCDLITDNTDYGCITTVQPIGASDQNSFWNAGYNVLDTSAGAGWSPYHHTPYDLIENVDLPICRALAAVNVATGTAVAGVVGEEPNLPPETVLAENCAATNSLLTLQPLFEWRATDFDGDIAFHEYRITQLPEWDGEVRSNVRPDEGFLEREWIELPVSQTSIVPPGLTEGDYRFEIRAIDDNGVADPTPASHTFTATGSLSPVLRVEIDAIQDTVEFLGSWSPGGIPRFGVFEGERLVFGLEARADDYCGTADAVAFAIGDTVGMGERAARFRHRAGAWRHGHIFPDRGRERLPDHRQDRDRSDTGRDDVAAPSHRRLVRTIGAGGSTRCVLRLDSVRVGARHLGSLRAFLRHIPPTPIGAGPRWLPDYSLEPRRRRDLASPRAVRGRLSRDRGVRPGRRQSHHRGTLRHSRARGQWPV